MHAGAHHDPVGTASRVAWRCRSFGNTPVLLEVEVALLPAMKGAPTVSCLWLVPRNSCVGYSNPIARSSRAGAEAPQGQERFHIEDEDAVEVVVRIHSEEVGCAPPSFDRG